MYNNILVENYHATQKTLISSKIHIILQRADLEKLIWLELTTITSSLMFSYLKVQFHLILLLGTSRSTYTTMKQLFQSPFFDIIV